MVESKKRGEFQEVSKDDERRRFIENLIKDEPKMRALDEIGDKETR